MMMIDQSWITPTVVIPFGSAVITAVYTVFAAMQWWVIRRQVNLQRNLQRLWLMFKPGDPNNGRREASRMWPLPINYTQETKAFVVPWNIINVGGTPAFVTRISARLSVVRRNEIPPPL